jgi:hypothetical protein
LLLPLLYHTRREEQNKSIIPKGWKKALLHKRKRKEKCRKFGGKKKRKRKEREREREREREDVKRQRKK